MAPLGMKGTKLLSDIITEAKIPNGQRKNQLVVKDANTIHWCVGLKIGRLSLANQNTKRILKITLIRI